MDLSTILLLCAITAGLFAGFAARFRSWGTGLADLATGLIAAALVTTLSIVVLVLTVDLNLFGIIHLVYLLIVVAFPIATAIIVIPHLLDAEFRTPIMAWLLLFGSVAAILGGLWATHVEPFRLQEDRVGLGAQGAEETLLLGVVADLQTGSIGDYEREVAARLIEADPDMIVLPGDLFEFDDPLDFDERAPEFIGWLRQLTDAVDAVVLVGGDHDTPEGVEAIAEAAGAVHLQDELVRLPVGDQIVDVVGLIARDGAERGAIGADIHREMRDTLTEDDLVILLTHAPDPVLNLEPTSPVDLVVAGHTHGGQVSLPFTGPLLTFSSVPDEIAAGGLFSYEGHPIYVSTGVGLLRGQAPQLRFGVPPSIGLITITPPVVDG